LTVEPDDEHTAGTDNEVIRWAGPAAKRVDSGCRYGTPTLWKAEEVGGDPLLVFQRGVLGPQRRVEQPFGRVESCDQRLGDG
jgi:hypothetical protein